MKNILLATAACLALSGPLAACATLPTPSPLQQTLVDDKALYAAEAAYFGAATAAEAAVDAGLLRGARAGQAAAALQTAHDALLVARTAYAAGNTASGLEAAARALAAVSDVQRLLQPRPG